MAERAAEREDSCSCLQAGGQEAPPATGAEGQRQGREASFADCSLAKRLDCRPWFAAAGGGGRPVGCKQARAAQLAICHGLWHTIMMPMHIV